MASDLMNRHPRTRPRGFTLIEMMITIALAAVLLAIVAPSFRQLIANQRIKTASFDLFSALNYARSEAVKRNAVGGVTLQAGALTNGAWGTGWRIVDPADASKNLRSWGAVNNLSVIEEAGPVASVTYGRDGRLTGGTAPRFEITTSPSISGVKARCVQVDLSGRPATAEGGCP
jgi:type IV fimbrial biogenesis protein FimT